MSCGGPRSGYYPWGVGAVNFFSKFGYYEEEMENQNMWTPEFDSTQLS